MKAVSTLTSPVIKLLEDDIDTDQMVPARFLRTAEAKNLGRYLFFDRRFGPDGTPRPEFPLNAPNYKGESILLVGANFGCGSSREHAPWAFLEFGIKAIVAPSFGEIFNNNCLKNALLTIVVVPEVHAALCRDRSPLTIDLEQQTLASAEVQTSFQLDPFARYCLLRGPAQIGYLTAQEPAIAAFEERHRRRLAPLSGLN